MTSVAVMRRSPLVVVLVLTVAACSDDTGGASTEPNTALAPAAEEAAEQATAEATPLGQMVDTDENSRFTITGYTVDGDEAGPWLNAQVRGEAATAAGTVPYTIAIRCASSTDTGGWLARSTVALSQEIPAGSFVEGTVGLLLPGDGRFGEPITPCETPAVVIIEAENEASWAIPDDVIAELNAKAEQYNATLGATPTT